MPDVESPVQKPSVLERNCGHQERRGSWPQNFTPPHFTFDEGMLIRGGGASQHPELWPDLVNSLLFNLERDGEGVRERS